MCWFEMNFVSKTNIFDFLELVELSTKTTFPEAGARRMQTIRHMAVNFHALAAICVQSRQFFASTLPEYLII